MLDTHTHGAGRDPQRVCGRRGLFLRSSVQMQMAVQRTGPYVCLSLSLLVLSLCTSIIRLPVPSASALGHTLLPYTISVPGELGMGAVPAERWLRCWVDAESEGRRRKAPLSPGSTPAPPASLGLSAALRTKHPERCSWAPPCLLSSLPSSLPSFLPLSFFCSFLLCFT